MSCETCPHATPAPVPYVAHESILARQERTIKRIWILAIILVVLLVVTNAGWIWYESQWEVVETTTIEAEQESETGSNYAVIGDIYGTTESKNDEN